MRPLPVMRLSLLALHILISPRESHAWLAPMGSLWQQTAAALTLTATLLGSPAPSPQQPMLGKELQSNLQKPTEDRPQIEIPSNLQQSASTGGVDRNAPIVEGTSFAGDSSLVKLATNDTSTRCSTCVHSISTL